MKHAWIAIALLVACRAAPPADETRVVDLTHTFDERTIFWPTSEQRFELEVIAAGHDDSGAWYAANEFRMAEHGGTHLDAPLHFASSGTSAAEVPVSRLMGMAHVIDIRAECRLDRDYQLAPHDIILHEGRAGRIEPGSVVLVHTGWGQVWPDAEAYLGTSALDSADDLHFPGIGTAAARMLVQREVDLVGIDTASIDHGPSRDFPAHRVLAEADVPGVENVARLDVLPPSGAFVVALPMKIGGGTGGPCRVVAFLP